MRYDTLIIGAGFSGLSAGIRAAMFGQKVAILEGHYLWGGLNSFYKRGGRLFDTGLHALTNYVEKGTKGTPLARVLRQLRIPYDALQLRPQVTSAVVSGGERLTFSNDVELLIAEIARLFPHLTDRFRAFVDELAAMPLGQVERPDRSTRDELDARFGEPLLTDLLLVPCCYYGSARPNDVDWDQFTILFRSIFIEGLSMPAEGVRPLLKLFVDRFKDSGGELRLKTRVARVLHEDSQVRGVELEDGSVLESDCVISSAGWVETMGLAGRADELPPSATGKLSFVETICTLDRQPHLVGQGPEDGMDAGVVFFNTAERFRYDVPGELCDLRSGVVSMPTNFSSMEPEREGVFRVTVLADHKGWTSMEEPDYVAAKQRWSDGALQAVTAFCGDVRPHETFRDVFTPRTLHKYTRHLNGAIYGSPEKRRDGQTPIQGLVLCGTDQGFLGIVGASVSGIAMANHHALIASS